MKLSVKPSNITQYHLVLEPGDSLYTACMWADILLNHDTYTLLVSSDCGNFTYGWTPTPGAESFLHLMCRVNSEYLLRKISKETEFFLDKSKKATVENIRSVCEDDDDMTKGELEDLCNEIMDIEDCGEECFCRSAIDSMDDHHLMDSFELLSVVKDYPAGAKTFVKLFCEVLQPELRKQLAEQEQNQSAPQKTPPSEKFPVVAWMTDLESGLTKAQIGEMLDLMPDDVEAMPFGVAANNSSAFGFIDRNAFEAVDYDDLYLQTFLTPILEDWNNESADGTYTLPHGERLIILCDCKTAK